MPTTPAGFRATTIAPEPPADTSPALQALWWVAKGDWERAHLIVADQQGDPACDVVHAHLHRQQGDEDSATSWYEDAGVTPSEQPLETEWEALVVRFLPAR